MEFTPSISWATLWAIFAWLVSNVCFGIAFAWRAGARNREITILQDENKELRADLKADRARVEELVRERDVRRESERKDREAAEGAMRAQIQLVSNQMVEFKGEVARSYTTKEETRSFENRVGKAIEDLVDEIRGMNTELKLLMKEVAKQSRP